jgi:hypothetical protein
MRTDKKSCAPSGWPVRRQHELELLVLFPGGFACPPQALLSRNVLPTQRKLERETREAGEIVPREDPHD